MFYEQYDARRGFDFRKTFPNLVEFYDGIDVLEIPQEDIQASKSVAKDGNKYAKRIVNPRWRSKSCPVKMRGRQTGESPR